MSIFKSSLFLAIAGAACILQYSAVQAIVTPQVFFTGDPVIASESFSAGDKITGTVEMWNYENYAMNDLVFNYQLLAGDNNGVPTQLVDNSQKGESFALAAGAKEVEEFTYTLPANLESGNYTFRIQLTNARGEKMSWAEKIINVGGNGKFITIDNASIVKNGEQLSNGAGVYYMPGEEVTVQFDASNDSKYTITATPSIITYNRNIGSDIINKKNESGVTLNPGEKKTLSYVLSKTNIPETYLTEVKLIDPSNNEPVSNTVVFRWIISGEGARTLYVGSDKTTYKEGDEAMINVQYNGPADHAVDAGTGTLDVKLSNPEGEVIGKSSQQVDLKPASVTVAVPVQQDADKFKIGVTLSKDNKGFDNYEVKVVPDGQQWNEVATSSAAEEKKEDNTPGKVAAAAALLILIAAAVSLYFKKHRARIISCFIAALLISVSAAGSALALVEVSDGCDADPIQITPSLPLPGSVVYAGGSIKFRDSMQIASCGNGLFFNKVNFYITEDKNIPALDAYGRSNDVCSSSSYCTKGGCLSCFGAHSSTYACSGFKWGDDVKRLDFTGYKYASLGSVSIGDVGGHDSSDWPHIVEFNKTSAIPSTVNFYGPVRFYIEYVGSHWDGNWNWNISYEKGYLRAVPEVDNLSATQPDYCIMNPMATFKWKFESDDTSASQAAYRIQISKSASFSSLVYDSSEVNSTSQTYAIPVGVMEYNKTYYWRIKVKDNYGTESDWATGSAITTPEKPAPHPAISYSPKTPIVLQRMTFSSANSYCHSGQAKTPCTDVPGVVYHWDFGNSDTSSLAEDTTVFQDKNNYTVKLTITDGPLTCSEAKVMIVNESLPTWQEVGD